MFFFVCFFCLQHSGNGYSQFQALSATCNKAFCPGATTEAMRGSVLCPGCQQPQRAAEPGLPHTLPREAAPPAFWGGAGRLFLLPMSTLPCFTHITEHLSTETLACSAGIGYGPAGGWSTSPHKAHLHVRTASGGGT